MKDTLEELRLPNFFIIGAAKCGTTSLAYYLNQHPNIFIPKDKETHFFDDEKLFAKGINFYAAHFFANANRCSARGDATPAYLHLYEQVIPRIQGAIPHENRRFIVVLRDPVARAWSHYRHMVKNGEEKLSFDRALKAEKERLNDNPKLWVGYYTDGLYGKQLKQWFESFGRESFLILFQHHFSENPGSILRKVFQFLNVDSLFKVTDLSRKNEGGIPRVQFLMKLLSEPSAGSKVYTKYVPSHIRRRIRRKIVSLNTKRGGDLLPDEQLMKRLRWEYLDDIRELENLLNIDLSVWRQDQTL